MSNLRAEKAKDFTEFLRKAVSPFHSVGTLISKLSGFQIIKDDDLMSGKVILTPGGKYIIHRNHSALMAIVIPDKFDIEKSGFTICAGHTDSPCLRVRPVSDVKSEGYLQLGCELYGGGLWHTWLDRELGMAGRVVIKTDDGLEERLVNIDEPVLLIPNLAIHLQTADERSAFKLEKEENTRPVICTDATDKIHKIIPNSWVLTEEGAPPMINRILANYMNVEVSQIVDMDISLFDSNPPVSWGLYKEFIASGRLDNQLSNYAIFNALSKLSASSIDDICLAVAFDHEEIGSTSWVGADSDLLPSWLEAIVDLLSNTFPGMPSYLSICRRSLLVSTDGAHGVNPNYSSKHQSQHKVKCGEGVVIKTNENQRYTTSGITRAFAKEVCKDEDVKIQDFVVKNTSPCGSTIGPSLSSKLSMRALDCGAPQWAMHSIRESCHVDDVAELEKFASAFYRNYRKITNRTIGL